MEKDHFQAISNDEDSLLLRWVDDFLVLTPHRELADQFLRTMHAGIPDYGCYVNSAKTLVNFDAVNPDGMSVRRVRQDEKFPWCGFLFDQQTLEAQCDYSRYDGELFDQNIYWSLIQTCATFRLSWPSQSLNNGPSKNWEGRRQRV